jgi:hypothetical protein
MHEPSDCTTPASAIGAQDREQAHGATGAMTPTDRVGAEAGRQGSKSLIAGEHVDVSGVDACAARAV